MFFKRLARILVAGTLLLQGCGLYTGEKAPQRAPPSFSGNGFSCVGRIPEHFDKYVNDKLSKDEITGFVSCLQKAFTTFATLTRGRSATSYAPEEIRRFLHEFFLGDRRISDPLMHEFMVLKQTMVGGALDLITREELYGAVEILEELKNEAILLKPHLKILNPRLAKTHDPLTLGKSLNEANEALSKTIQTFAARLQKNQRNYPLSNLENFLIEFRAFAGWEKHFSSATPPTQWVNFLRVFRQFTVAPSDSAVVRPLDWTPLLQSFARWYLVFLQYEIGIKDQPILRGVGLQNSVQMGQDVFNLLEQAASKQSGLILSFEQLNEMVTALHGLGWISSGIRPTSLHTALNVIVTRVLGDPEIPASQRRSEGLSLAAISRARDLFFRWAYIQMNLDTRLAGALASQRIVPNVQIRPYLNPQVRQKLRSLQSSEWDDFLSLRNQMRPLFAEDSYRVSLVRKTDLARHNVRHTYHNLSMMNIWRSGANLLFRGYAEQAGSRIGWDSGITIKEMERFYADFRELGIDLWLVDSRNPNMGGRDFTSANLFTYSADGLELDQSSPKGRLRMVEAMELFSFLFSGGEMAKDFYSTLSDRCAKGPPDLYKRETISRSCVVEQLPDVFDKFLTSMPDLHQFLRIAPVQVRNNFARTLLETSFSPKFSQTQWVEINELTTLAVILHYSEAVMTRYDANHDGSLNNSEIDQAAEVFMGFIKKFAKEKMNQNLSDRQARGAFYYILTYKEMPTGFWDIAWLSYVSSGNLNLNRAELSTVFRVIIAKLFDTGKKPEPVVVPPPTVPCQGTDIVLLPDCGTL